MTDSLIYFAIISVAFCLGLVWFARRADNHELSQRTAMDIGLALMFGGFLGSRAFHVLYEAPSLYLENPMQIFRVWEGGFVWYGGVIVGLLTAVAIIKSKREPLAKWLDVLAPVAAASYALGRTACWFEGCCYGRYCTIADFQFQFPAQLFAVVWEAGVAFYLLLREARPSSKTTRDGSLFATYLILHGLGRVVMEIFRDDERGPAIGPLTVSILISIVLIAIGFIWRRSLKIDIRSR